jgi:gamma-glutamylcyclotransferase (GGCT)/AIG2-like uncharacterized protein YtfP
MSEYLFVYGTLLGETPDPDVNRLLRRHCRDAGAASVAGRLYRLGWYPGLVIDANTRERVAGRLLRVLAPARCWPALDAYEGFDPGAPDRSEFVRRKLMVGPAAGGPDIDAWTYVYNGSLSRGEPIDRWPPL